jgi:hypothetical protein
VNFEECWLRIGWILSCGGALSRSEPNLKSSPGALLFAICHLQKKNTSQIFFAIMNILKTVIEFSQQDPYSLFDFRAVMHFSQMSSAHREKG